MRKIIHGVIYDISKATEIVTGPQKQRDCSAPHGSIWQKRTLYLSAQQNCFFVRFGGFFTRKPKEIIPIDQVQAFKFLHDNNEIDLILRYFPDRAKIG